jgi:hypothetical protein
VQNAYFVEQPELSTPRGLRSNLALVKHPVSADDRQRQHLLAELVVADGLANPIRVEHVLVHALAVTHVPPLVV